MSELKISLAAARVNAEITQTEVAPVQPEGKERNRMEHRFGIFDTVEELNRAAAAQKAEEIKLW